MVFEVPVLWRADIHALALSTFLTTHINVHTYPWICMVRPDKYLPSMRAKEAASACR